MDGSTSQDSDRGTERGARDDSRSFLARVVAWALQRRLVRVYLRYSEHRGPRLADSITYRALFSVFAALLLGFSLAALWIGGNPEAMRALVETLDEVVPGLTDVVDPSRVQAPVGFTLVGVASLLALLWAAIGAIGSLRDALLELADETRDDGFFLWVILRNLLVALCFGGLLLLAAGLTIFSSTGVEAVTSWLGLTERGVTETLSRILGVVIVLAIDTVAVALVFRLLSGVAAPRRALWMGALFGGVGLVVLQELSSLLVRGATANPLLASFASLIALLIWFNLSAQVILLASTYIIVATAESHDRVRERYGAQTLAQYRRRRAEDRLHAATRELRAAREAEENER